LCFIAGIGASKQALQDSYLSLTEDLHANIGALPEHPFEFSLSNSR